MIKRTEKTVSSYLSRYCEGGIEALALGYSPGKPHRLTDEQEQLLTQTIATKKPSDVGIEAKLCVLVDLFNQEIIGYSAGPNKDAALISRAFASVLGDLRQIQWFHTDRGNEFKNHKID